MKKVLALIAVLGCISASSAVAQSSNTNIRVKPGHFCHQNKCMRFSRDLGEVSIQGRRALSIGGMGLRRNPVISSRQFRDLFYQALRQVEVNGTRG